MTKPPSPHDQHHPSTFGSGSGPTSRGRLRDFSRSLPMSLLRAREAVMGHFRPSLRAFDMTEQQWRVLRALTSVDRIGTMHLASATFLLAPSLSRIVRDLEARGLVQRSGVAEDLRRGMVSISPKGRDLVARAGERSEAIYAEITARYGKERLQLLQSMLAELEDVLQEPIDPSSSR